MAITRAKKEQLVQDYTEMLSKARLAVVTSYQGLTVAEMTNLRRQLRAVGIDFHVVKNTLVKRTLDKLGVSTPEELWRGPQAIGASAQDPVATAKTLLDYTKNEERLVIKAAILGTRLLTEADVSTLANLPAREVLLGQLLAGLQSPLTGLVTVLGGTLRGLVNVLDARVRQLQESNS